MDTQELLSLNRINQILSRHFGSKRAVAREAGASASYTSNVLRGRRRSERILALADQRARDWLEWERARREPAASSPDDD
jgi:hypothetical protein